MTDVMMSSTEVKAILAEAKSELELVRDDIVARTAATETLVAKARTLVDLTDDAERNHGGLISVALLRAKNELRLELSKWAK